MQHKRIALITGANQGVGYQVAKELAANGVTVLVGSRNLKRGQDAAKEIGSNAIPVQIDVTDRASIARAAEYVRKEFGRLDLLINNAAISNIAQQQLGLSLLEYAELCHPSVASLDEMRSVWETNVFGALAVYQAMLPLLREGKDARIVIVSSSLGSLGKNADPTCYHRGFYSPVYAMSKTALSALGLSIMIELEQTDIKVNLVSPGFTSTNLNLFEGLESLEDGSREVVRVALFGPEDPSGTFTEWENQTIPW